MFVEITKLLNKGLFNCVAIDIITAHPLLITNGLKQYCVIGQFLLSPYSTVVFKDSTKRVRLSQCEIFIGNVLNINADFSFFGSLLSNSVLTDHGAEN